MRAFQGIRRLFHLGLWGPRVEEAVEWEIRHHLEERADELEARGLSREEALAEARRSFGDVAAVERELRTLERGRSRRRRLGVWLETVRGDVAYALRGLGRNPGFAAALVLTLGLGVGATTAVFTVVDALLLRPLPYAASTELAQVEVVAPGASWGQRYIPRRVAAVWQEESTFDRLLLHQRASALFTGGAEPLIATVQVVSPSFEEVLGVAPVLGRGFLSEDATPEAEPVVLLDHAFWRSGFGADPAVVGATIRLDDLPHMVIGVMPRGFKFPEYARTEGWIPLREDGSVLGRSNARAAVEVLARVPGGRFDAAEARATTVAAGVFAESSQDAPPTVRLSPMEEVRGGDDATRRAVWLLFGGVLLILLVAAVNGANLLLVRGLGRTREVAVRAALGASRPRLVRQLVTESMLLALLSAVVAVAVAHVALVAIHGIMPRAITFHAPHEFAVGRRALGFAFCIALGSGFLLGLLPAFRTTTAARAIAGGGLTPYAAATPGRSRLRRGLVVLEVALSVLLLAGAGLFINSFVRMMAVDPGVRVENLALLHLPVAPLAHGGDTRSDLLPRLEERIGKIPGVVAASANGSLPASGLQFGVVLEAEGARPRDGASPQLLPTLQVGPGFFDVTGARLLAGRSFTDAEIGSEAEPVAIIDEHLARHLWPDEAPVGQRFRVGPEEPWRTVVGVSGDLRVLGPETREGDFEVLYPFDPRDPSGHHQVTLAIRTDQDPGALFPAIRAAVHEIAPRQPIQELTTAKAAFAEEVELPRFLTVLMSALAAFALFLAAIGLYGVLAHGVSSRAREIGVRMALGADRTGIRGMVVREGALLALVGAALGLAGFLALARFVRGMLFQIEPTDPMTLAAVIVTLLAASLAAAYLPARRATRMDPATTLRLE